jgi:hypothetical protein
MPSRHTIAYGIYALLGVLAFATIEDRTILMLTVLVLAAFAFKTYVATKINP